MKNYFNIVFFSIIFTFNNSTNAQDIIETIVGNTIEAKVVEISDTNVTYKLKLSTDDTYYIIKITDVKMIIFENGHVEHYSKVAQQKIKVIGEFVRIYNLEGKKFIKGYVHSVTDTSIWIKENRRSWMEKKVSIDFSKIGKIKYKRSGGGKIAKGAIIGTAVGVVLGAVITTSEDSFFSDGEVIGAVAAVGLVVGTIFGAFTALPPPKRLRLYSVDGDLQKWRSFKEIVK